MSEKKTVTITQISGADINVHPSGATTITITAEKTKLILKIGINDIEYLAGILWKAVTGVRSLVTDAGSAMRGPGARS